VRKIVPASKVILFLAPPREFRLAGSVPLCTLSDGTSALDAAVPKASRKDDLCALHVPKRLSLVDEHGYQ